MQQEEPVLRDILFLYILIIYLIFLVEISFSKLNLSAQKSAPLKYSIQNVVYLSGHKYFVLNVHVLCTHTLTHYDDCTCNFHIIPNDNNAF